MKIKKILCLLLAGVLVTSTCSATISAETSKDTSSKQSEENMKSALTIAKSRYTIPEELTEFKYDFYNDGLFGSYSFKWYKANEEYNNYIRISVENNNIVSYQRYKPDVSYNNNPTPSFAKLSDEQILSKAKAYAKQLNPDIYNSLKFELSNISLNSNSAVVSFKRYSNDIAFSNNDGRITIDKDTGELLRYNLNWLYNAEFSSLDKEKSVDEIKENYKQLNEFQLFYDINKDYETKETTVELLYKPEFTGKIDAFTGKESTYDTDYQNNYDDVANPTTGEGMYNDSCTEESQDVAFTPKELDALKDNKDLKTKDEVVSIIKNDKYFKLDSNYKLNYSSLTQDYFDESIYLWNVSFRAKIKDSYYYTNATVNAKTGKIENFYQGIDKASKKATLKSAQTIANEAIKHYLGDKASEYRFEEDTTYKKEYYTKSLSYARYVNDIIVPSDKIYIDVNGDGVVTSFSYDYTDIEFPKPDVITVDKAYENLFNNIEFNHYYIGFEKSTTQTNTYLCYQMPAYQINALTGEVTNSYYNSDDEQAEYTDLDDHWAKKYIEKLADYNITLDAIDGKFNPNSSITQEEFEQLLSKITSSYTPYYEEEVTEDETVDGSNKTEQKKSITKAEACKIFVQRIGGEEYAQMKGIYKVPFKDTKSTRSDIGYIAIAYGKGFVFADSNGNFNADSKLTRAMAMYLIYNYLSK